LITPSSMVNEDGLSVVSFQPSKFFPLKSSTHLPFWGNAAKEIEQRISNANSFFINKRDSRFWRLKIESMEEIASTVRNKKAPKGFP
jgi:hypothetical protein